jgi:hypothetical protein
MGFAETFFGRGGDDPRSQAIAALASGLMQGNAGAGFQNASNVFAQAPTNALKMKMLQAQLAETEAQGQERQMNVKKTEAAMQEAARIKALLASAGQPLPGMGGTGAVNAGLPQDMQIGGLPNLNKQGIDYQSLIRQGVPLEQVKALAESANFGRPKVARTIEGMQGGRPATLQYDEYGQPVGQGVEQWKAPVFQNLGSRTVALDPVSLGERGSFNQGMSPSERDASARGWAGIGIQRDQAQSGKAPQGYRWAADGTSLEAIPGGPASKTATASEGERKAATLLARLQGSEKQLGTALKENPDAAKPGVVASGLRAVGAEALANTAATGSERQRVEAAQLDMLDAALTLGTGAAYTREQLEGYRKSYFPQLGDTADNVRDKQARLQNVINAAKIAAGRAAPQGSQAPQAGGASGGWEGGGMPPQSAIAAELARRKGMR